MRERADELRPAAAAHTTVLDSSSKRARLRRRRDAGSGRAEMSGDVKKESAHVGSAWRGGDERGARERAVKF